MSVRREANSYKSAYAAIPRSGSGAMVISDPYPAVVMYPAGADYPQNLYSRELWPGLSYARVLWDPVQFSYFYEVLEAPVPEGATVIMEELRRAVKNEAPAVSTLADMDSFVLRKLRGRREVAYHSVLSYHLFNEFVNNGKIASLLRDPDIEDISFAGVGAGTSVPVYVFHRRVGYVKTNVFFHSDSEVEGLLRQMATRADKSLNYSSPIGEWQLPDGSRMEAKITSQVSGKGSAFTIRRFRENPLNFKDIIKAEEANSMIYAILWLATESKLNMAFIGGTASGKTTMMNSVLAFVPPRKKIISIEDTREINLHRENWTPLVTRTGFVKVGGRLSGEIDIFDLLKVSLRQRPDYLVVGECRGAETKLLVQTMASGNVSMTTFHADSIETFFSRLTTKPIEIDPYTVGVIDLVVHVGVMDKVGSSRRKVLGIYEALSDEPFFAPIVTYNYVDDSWDFTRFSSSYTFRKIRDALGMTNDSLFSELRRRIEYLMDVVINNREVNYDEIYSF